MGLTSELLRQRRIASKTPSEYSTRLMENTMMLSLRELLGQYLLEHDRLMIEVDRSALGVFSTVLLMPEFKAYRCTQIEDNKFVFSANEFIL